MKKISLVLLPFLISISTLSSYASASYTAPHLSSYNIEKVTSTTSSNIIDASYTIGFSIGKNMIEQLKQQDIELDHDSLKEGFITGVEGNKPRLSQEQMEQSMETFQKEMEAKIRIKEQDRMERK